MQFSYTHIQYCDKNLLKGKVVGVNLEKGRFMTVTFSTRTKMIRLNTDLARTIIKVPFVENLELS